MYRTPCNASQRIWCNQKRFVASEWVIMAWWASFYKMTVFQHKQCVATWNRIACQRLYGYLRSFHYILQALLVTYAKGHSQNKQTKTPPKTTQKTQNMSSHVQVQTLICTYYHSLKSQNVKRHTIYAKINWNSLTWVALAAKLNKTAYAQSARRWSCHSYFDATCCEYPIKIWLETELRYRTKGRMWQKKP